MDVSSHGVNRESWDEALPRLRMTMVHAHIRRLEILDLEGMTRALHYDSASRVHFRAVLQSIIVNPKLESLVFLNRR